jgi:Fe2+ or Zn2+ uptake regulation protein
VSPAPGRLTDLLDDVGGRLRARGERMTAPRRAVLTVLARQEEHLGAEAVVEAVSALDPAVHRASVYRALEALSELGVVQHVHVGHGGTAYHLTDPHVHLHAQCRRCAVILDLEPGLLDGVAGTLLSAHAFVLEPGHVALSGLCERCSAS